MVGQEILVLFIMVRIRAPQPKIQPAFAGFIFGRARIGQSANGTRGQLYVSIEKPYVFMLCFNIPIN